MNSKPPVLPPSSDTSSFMESMNDLAVTLLYFFVMRPDFLLKLVAYTVLIVHSVYDAFNYVIRQIRLFFKRKANLSMNFYVLNKRKIEGEIKLVPVNAYNRLALYMNGLPGGQNVFETKISAGRQLFDLASFQDDFLNKVISEKLKIRLEKAGITGFKTFNIEVKGSVEKYYGLVVTGRAGARILPAKKGLVIGLEFDPQTWDGSDMFMLADYNKIFLTARAMRIFKKMKTGNASFHHILNYHWYNETQIKVIAEMKIEDVL